MSTFGGLGNFLIVKAILTGDFNFHDTTYGETKKKLIQGRVKKMSWSERRELLNDLDVVKKIARLEANPPALKERGVCVLLLNPDDKETDFGCAVGRAFFAFLNFLGIRVSSAAVIEKLGEARDALTGASFASSAMNVEAELQAQITSLDTQIKDRAKENNIGSLLLGLNKIRDSEVRRLRDANWESVFAFVELESALELFKGAAQTKVTDGEVKKFINDSIGKIQELITKHKTSGKRKSEIIGAISINLRYIEVELEGHLSSVLAEKTKLKKELNLVKKRLADHEKNVANAAQHKNSAASRTKIQDASTQLNALNEIVGLIDRLTKCKNLPVFVATITSINSRLQGANVTIKNMKSFAAHFDLLAKFATNDLALNKQHLADVIDLSVLNHSTQQELSNRLNGFKQASNGYSTDDHRLQVINDIVAYWKIVFDGAKEEQQQVFNAELAKIQPKKQVSHPTSQASTPTSPPSGPAATSVTVQQPVASTASLPSAFVIPDPSQALKNKAANTTMPRGLAVLTTVAAGLQTVREDPHADVGWFRQIGMPQIDNGILQVVYGNFYWIMRDLNKLGAVNEQGHSTDSNWAGNVFTTGESNGQAPDISRPLLNHYRVQAIVEALKGHFRTGPNQNPTL